MSYYITDGIYIRVTPNSPGKLPKLPGLPGVPHIYYYYLKNLCLFLKSTDRKKISFELLLPLD